ALADQLYRLFIFFQTISNDVYGFHRIYVLVPYFEQFCASVDEIMNLKNWIKSIPVHMDYEGQKLAERLFHIIILFFGVVGFLWGYYIQQFGATFIILAAGFIVSCLIVLPPWPMYRKNPLDWQKPRPEKSDTKREGGKKKK
ncbi:unnamed protein product, partial [Porites lobata]